MPEIENIEGLREYRDKNKPRVVLDTNILIYGCTGKKDVKELIKNLYGELDVCISDTVYWEFLRNNSIENFRKRRVELSKWKDGDLLKEDAILREDENVEEMHARLFLLLMKLIPSDPRRVLRLLSPDLWIAAAAIVLKYDHILTTDYDDFPSELFSEIGKFVAGDFHVHLLVFKRDEVRQWWLELDESRALTISCNSFFHKRKK